MVDCVREKSAEVSGKNSVEIIFEDVPPGNYAISAFFDTNGNGVLDAQGLFQMPAEPFGFSQNPKLFFGPPKFKQCTFQLRQDNLKLYINLKQY